MQLAAQEAWEALRLPEADAPEASGQMLYYQPPDEQCARNGYDTLLEHEITAAVTACKAKEVRHLLERFTAKMLEKNIRGYERQFYIQRLVAAMLAVAENAGLSVNQVLADRQANLFETISKIYTADQMQNFLMDEVAVPVMDLLTEFRQSSSSELVKNVLALIKQTRGDITLNECADRLNYNPSYIWKVLRTEKDTSFSDLANMKAGDGQGTAADQRHDGRADRRDAELFQCAEFHPIFQQKGRHDPPANTARITRTRRSEGDFPHRQQDRTRCVSGAVFAVIRFLCAVH